VSVAEGVTVSMDIEQLIYEAGRDVGHVGGNNAIRSVTFLHEQD
jgi:hypothetical protein